MTREHAQQEREAFNAFCEGKPIQVRLKGETEWYDTANPTFAEDAEHRIKPESSKVPLGPEDIDLHRDVFRWRNTTRSDERMIANTVSSAGVWLAYNTVATPWLEAQSDLLISRDGGWSWRPCEKEAA